MKGIILAGGFGTRLYPVTKALSKQLLPVYDKPMIYYPISVLLQAEISEILIISTPRDLPLYKSLLGDGARIGVKFEFIEQPYPNGLAEAFIIGEDFIGQDSVCLVLGDNIFYGEGLDVLIGDAMKINNKATIFGYTVKDPQRYGVIGFNSEGEITSIEEKPEVPKSDKAVMGLYCYPNSVIEIAKKVKPSNRGEKEITSINQSFLDKGLLNLQILGRGFSWLDTGTPESLLEAGQFIQTIEKRQGIKVACLEEISFKNKWISKKKLLELAIELSQTDYGKYLLDRYNN